MIIKTNVIDQDLICRFVNMIEKHKGYRRDYNYVFRHIVSEIGELDAAIHRLERHRAIPGSGGGEGFFVSIGDELWDVIFLCCYMAEMFGVDLNRILDDRMKSISEGCGLEKTKRKGEK